ncbi:MAG: AAA+ family ATPase [Rhodobacteraceae bacterium]|nr:AAA+ family ATPase [Alphaproteobacteria bacterium]MBT8476941.1 AAA+ family ATPase [Alphaproteobacteria bacterium]NNF72911.1 AAA+ family ATPase [Paracoccaceae bacterium]NNK66541.1 AAA+ family ATPase [Paracoccaceae bacterium]
MRLFAILIVSFALTQPATAQDDVPPRGEMEQGLDLLGEGTRLLLRGLMDELEPALRGLREGLEDLDAYHPPEMLPNGDIIIRRKRAPGPPAEGEVDI